VPTVKKNLPKARKRMSRSTKKTKNDVQEHSIYDTVPWTSSGFGNESEIDARMQATGHWETLATVRSVDGFDADDIAGFIIIAVNNYKKTQTLLKKVRATIELCQKSDGLNSKIKQNIDETLGALSQQHID
jgi:hypothetical protein